MFLGQVTQKVYTTRFRRVFLSPKTIRFDMTTGNSKFKSAGKSQPMSVNNQAVGGSEGGKEGGNEGGNEGSKDGAGSGAGTGAGEGGQAGQGGTGDAGQAGQQGGAGENNSGATGADISDDVLISGVNKKFNKEFKTIDEVNSFLNPPAQESDEEKAQKEKAFDKRMLDFYVSNGGKVEDFVELKKIAASDLTQVSEAVIKQEMKDEGFSEEEIDAVLAERYYQLEDADIEAITDEKEKELAKKKKEFGKKKYDSRGKLIKNKAEATLNNLKAELEAEDAEAKLEATFTSNVDEHLSKIPRKMTFELGKSNDEELAPVEVNVEDADIEAVKEVLKDPAKRNQYFFNEDGQTINLSNIAKVMLRNQVLERALKVSHLAGGSREVQKLKAQFGGDPGAVGLGGSGSGSNGRQGKKGKLAGYGKATLVR
jgi:hypothetical protein